MNGFGRMVFNMDVKSEIAVLRGWLTEDETRLQGPFIKHQSAIADRDRLIETNFNDFANQWPNGPNVPWGQFNNWGNGR